MKVGTDGVLLGAWARLEPTHRRIIDVGCGTGLIALMAAQRTEEWGARVVGVEIEEGLILLFGIRSRHFFNVVGNPGFTSLGIMFINGLFSRFFTIRF